MLIYQINKFISFITCELVNEGRKQHPAFKNQKQRKMQSNENSIRDKTYNSLVHCSVVLPNKISIVQ
jgi:hypothetical protein